MPRYTYLCETCGETLDIIQEGFDKLTVCGPHCQAPGAPGNGQLSRLMSLPAPLTSQRAMALGKTNPEKAAAQGFTTFKRQGKGHYERIAGSGGPETIDMNAPTHCCNGHCHCHGHHHDE